MNRTTLLRVIFGLALAGSLALELVGEKAPYQHPWDWPLFFALTGAVGCLLLSVVAKGIVSPVLDRPQGFYDTDAAEYKEIQARFQGRDDEAGVGNGRPPAAEATQGAAQGSGAGVSGPSGPSGARAPGSTGSTKGRS